MIASLRRSSPIFGLTGFATLLFAAPALSQLTALGAVVLDPCDAPADCVAEERFSRAIAAGDFNDDGFDDLAVGVLEEVSGDNIAGEVHVMYGSAAGLTHTGEQFFNGDSSQIGGEAEPGDLFGSALVASDFDRDGIDDLAIGVPGENVGDVSDAGAVVVLFGSANGLTTAGNRVLTQNSLPAGSAESAEQDDKFGSALAARANGGLAIAATGETFIPVLEANAGLVHKLGSSAPGSALDTVVDLEQNDFLTACGNSDGNEAVDRWGSSLVSGNFGGGTTLVIGAPEEDLGTALDAGRITIDSSSDDCVTQANSAEQDVEGDDEFGRALAAGDFDGDGRDDLAVGVPREVPSGSPPGERGGIVQILRGGASGIVTSDTEFFAQDNFPGEGISAIENGDRFGASLATGDFDGNGRDDLAIGAPDDDVGAVEDAGMVNVRYGTNAGFNTNLDQTFNSNSPAGMPDSSNTADQFGATLARGDFDHNGVDDLAIGMPGEGLGTQARAGAVTVLYGLERDTGGFGLVAFPDAAVSFPEDPGNRILFVNRTGGAVVAASVDYARTGGTAAAGDDFTFSDGSEAWAIGDLGLEFFAIGIHGDTLDEADETVVIELSGASAGLAIGSPDTLTVTIEDDDEGGVLQFATSASVSAESAGTAAVIVSRTSGLASGVTVNYVTTAGTATDGSDYIGQSDTLTFGAGEVSRQIDVQLINDTEDEPAQAFTLTLSNPAGGATLGGQISTAVVLTDDDPVGQLFVDGFESGNTAAW